MGRQSKRCWTKQMKIGMKSPWQINWHNSGWTMSKWWGKPSSSLEHSCRAAGPWSYPSPAPPPSQRTSQTGFVLHCRCWSCCNSMNLGLLRGSLSFAGVISWPRRHPVVLRLRRRMFSYRTTVHCCAPLSPPLLGLPARAAPRRCPRSQAAVRTSRGSGVVVWSIVLFLKIRSLAWGQIFISQLEPPLRTGRDMYEVGFKALMIPYSATLWMP
jgi:hypothetical protein